MDDQMWAEFSERYLWRNPHVQITQVVPAGVQRVKRELGLQAIADGKAKEVSPPTLVEDTPVTVSKGEGE